MDTERAYEQRWWILGVLTLSLLIIGLDNTILNVAIPSLQRSLSATTSELQWIIDSYVLVFAGLLLAAGALGDRFGRKRSLQAGLVVFGLASLGCALATSSAQLVFWRAVAGAGGAFIMPATLSILTNVFPPAERPKAIGIWAGVSGLAIGLGPIAGGFLIQQFHWSAVFYLNVPVVLLALVSGRMLIPESRDPDSLPVDWVGAALSIVGLSALVFAIIDAPNTGWGDARVLGVTAFATVTLLAFGWWEYRTPHAMLDLWFFRSARFTAASLSVTLVFFALFGSLFAMTQLMQFVFGYSALDAGVRISPIAFAILGGSILGGRSVAWLGAKIAVTIGLTIVSCGLLYLGLWGGEGYVHLLASILVMGAGMGIAMAPSTDAIMGSLPLAKSGIGSALNDTTRQVGGALGVAILGSILSSSYRSGMRDVVAELPPQFAGPASDSLGAALAISRTMGGAGGAALAESARVAFIQAMSHSVLLGSIVAFAGALMALVYLPAREVRTQEEIDEAFARRGAAQEAEAAAHRR